jgi:L-alanine-DL-glutamate epimerase-like enolase superfamily enzyme
LDAFSVGVTAQCHTDSLKIVKVEPHLLTGVRGYAPWLFVRVETAEGIVGWGEGTNFPGVQPIATAIGNLRSAVVGQSAWDIEKLWNRMYRYLYYNGMGGVVMAAISAIDIALYDVVGKKLGVPVGAEDVQRGEMNRCKLHRVLDVRHIQMTND